MIRFALRVPALAAACALLAACSGGAGGSSSTAVPPAKTPSDATATFVVKIPAKPSVTSASKQPAYITSNVKGIDFSVTSPTNALAGYVFYPLTASSTYCTSSASGLTCTLDVNAVPGSDTFTVNLYDATEPGQGFIVSTGHVTATISAQQSNSINITTDGVPTYGVLGASNPFPAVGTTTQIPLSLQVVDPDGNIIVGSYDMPVTLSSSDTTGATSVSPTSISQASDAANLTFTNSGPGTTPITLTATSTSPALANHIVSPQLASITIAPGQSGPAASPSTLYFAHANSGAQTLTVTGEGGSVGPFSVNSYTCAGYVTISGTSPTFTITPTASTFSATAPGYNNTGPCTIQVLDAASRGTYVGVIIGL